MSGSIHFPWGIITPDPKSCYGNLASYGNHGAVKGIVAPRPTTSVPTILNTLGSNHVQMRNIDAYISAVPTCSPYASAGANSKCPKEEFSSMYRY